MHLSSGTTGSTAVHPNVRSSHPQNFLHIVFGLDVNVFKFCFAAQVLADEVLSVDGVVTHVEKNLASRREIWSECSFPVRDASILGEKLASRCGIWSESHFPVRDAGILCEKLASRRVGLVFLVWLAVTGGSMVQGNAFRRP